MLGDSCEALGAKCPRDLEGRRRLVRSPGPGRFRGRWCCGGVVYWEQCLALFEAVFILRLEMAG